MKLRLAILGSALAVAALFIVPKLLYPKFVVRAYFTDAMNLHNGAPVRLAGVQVGLVKSVRARAEMKKTPAEVVMVISPGYELRIPDDSIVELETAGVLGDTFVEIEISGTSGAPVPTNGVLRVRPTVQFTAGQAIEKLGDAIKKRCDCDLQMGSLPVAQATRASPRPRNPDLRSSQLGSSLVHVLSRFPPVILPFFVSQLDFTQNGLHQQRLYQSTDRHCCRRCRPAGIWLSRLHLVAEQSGAGAGALRGPRPAHWPAGQHQHESLA